METGSVGIVTPEQLEHQAGEIAKDQGTFDRNIFLQETVANGLRQRWKDLAKTDQSLLLQRYALLFPRTRENDNPQACLRRILNLQNGEDVQRALRVRAADYRDYTCDRGEEIYPTTGWLGRYLDYARWNEAPLALHFWAGVSILGAAVRRNYFVDNGRDYIWMNQFIILTGAKANGKTDARKAAKSVILRMNRKLAKMEETKEIISAKAFQVPLMASDITPEDIVDQLADWSALPRHIGPGEALPGEAISLIISDELSNLLGKSTFNAPKKIPLFTELCFNDEYHRSTKSGGQKDVERMAFSILACTQPGWMRNTVVSDAMEGGFLERANFIHRPSSTRVYATFSLPMLDPLQAESLADRLVEIAGQTGNPQLLMPSDEGKEFFDDWYIREHKKGPRDKEDFSLHTLKRRCIHLLRIASLLCISERTSLPFLEISHIRQALTIIEAEDEFYPQFISEASETNDSLLSKQILNWITSQGGCVKKTHFSAQPKFKGLLVVKRNELISNLVEAGDIYIYNGRGGKWYVLCGQEESDEAKV